MISDWFLLSHHYLSIVCSVQTSLLLLFILSFILKRFLQFSLKNKNANHIEIRDSCCSIVRYFINSAIIKWNNNITKVLNKSTIITTSGCGVLFLKHSTQTFFFIIMLQCIFSVLIDYRDLLTSFRRSSYFSSRRSSSIIWCYHVRNQATWSGCGLRIKVGTQLQNNALIKCTTYFSGVDF